jgi:hypothetical protein
MRLHQSAGRVGFENAVPTKRGQAMQNWIQRLRRARLTAVLVGLGALAVVPLAMGGSAEPARATATLQLNGTLDLVSILAAPCPAGTRSGVACPGRAATGVVPGLGRVTESYSFLADTTPSSCPAGSVKILGYPVRWVVAGKGELHFAVDERSECIGSDAGFTVDQSFTITGGTGSYAGASGSGTADRTLSQTDRGAAGRETWTGTLTVPGLEFDLARPAISGARAKTARLPRAAKRVRVTYAVTAQDAADGTVPVTCKPASGSRFKAGRTTVRCSATDTSGNTATAAFPVTVKARR